MKRFWEKSSEQQNRVLIVAFSSNMTATKNIYHSWWKTTSKRLVKVTGWPAHWIPLNICKVKERPRSIPKDHQISSISLSFLLFRTILNSMPCILTRQKQPSVFLPPLSRSPSMFLLCIMLSYSFSYILHLFRFVIWTLSDVSRGVLLRFYPPTFLSLFFWLYAWQILTSDNLTKSTISTMHMCTYLCTLHISGLQSDLEAECPSLWFGGILPFMLLMYLHQTVYTTVWFPSKQISVPSHQRDKHEQMLGPWSLNIIFIWNNCFQILILHYFFKNIILTLTYHKIMFKNKLDKTGFLPLSSLFFPLK